jgi:hypothetical protein
VFVNDRSNLSNPILLFDKSALSICFVLRLNFLFLFFKNSSQKPKTIMVTLVSQENMVALVARTGRHLQRYNKQGRRQVVGLVPFFLSLSN